VFGPHRFRNEIAWCYWGPGAPRQRQFSRKHDVILWYTKGSTWTWNADAVRMPHAAKTIENYRVGLVGSGFAPGVARPASVLASAGKIPEDWWPIAIAPRGKEYLGYPTQKPLKLLDRIIRAASNEGDIVLDPFCGCGTSVDAAEALGRKWIGIDVTHHAIGLIKYRLISRYGPSIMDEVEVTGEPTTAEDAAVLARDDPYQFQAWALGLVGARKGPTKKGGDHGVDGRLFFHETAGGASREIVFSVKAGGVNPGHVRDLRGVVDREAAEIGVLISFVEPSPGMRAEAASAGFYNTPSSRYPRVQVRTVAELLAGRGIDYPTIPEPFRGVFWDEDQVPKVKRPARHSARHLASKASPAAEQSAVAESPYARRIREEVAAASREGPRSPHTTKRDRKVPLPSPGSADTD
jgi:site-specific DNA-methyltransferase (adenine-specific)